MLLLLDNYDSFTYNLYDYFVQCGAEVEVVRNDDLDVSTILDRYHGIVISPGPGVPADAGCTMQILEKYYDKLPIFGVCLGMQAIGEFFGGTVSQASFPMHGKVSTVAFDSSHSLFRGIIPPLNVCRYHSLVLEKMDKTPFSIISQTDKNEPMAIAHKSLPIWAVQFHPEAILTPQGLTLIKNWLSCFSLQNTK